MFEEHARGAMQLGNDNPLCAIDDERTGGRHERNFAHIDLLFLHFLDGLLRRFTIHDDQAYSSAERTRKSQAALLAFLYVKGGFAQRVIYELQPSVAAMARDRKDRGKGGLQALIAALRRRDVRLQESQVGLQLSGQQERHIEHARTLGKALADAFFLGIGVRHIGSGGEKSVFSCQLHAAPCCPMQAAGNWKLGLSSKAKGWRSKPPAQPAKTALLDLGFRAGVFQLLLDCLGVSLWDRFLDRLGCAID